MSIKKMKCLDAPLAEMIKRLEKKVIENDHVSLKLEIDYKLAHKQNELDYNDFFYFDGLEMVGYLGILAFGSTAEISGIVHPDFRRRGIFTMLFEEAKKTFQSRGFDEVLILADEKSLAGKYCIEQLGGIYHNSEYEMLFTNHPLDSRTLLTFSKSTPNDLSTVVAIDESCFGNSYSNNLESTYVARDQDHIVGKVRLELLNNNGGIYGLGVFPAFRNKGFGKCLLENSVYELKKQGAEKIHLQVLTDNENALGLYLNTGFEIDSRMDYYSFL